MADLARIVTWFGRVVDALARVMTYASGALFFVLSFYIVFEALGRKFLGYSLNLSDQMSGYTLAVGGMWGLAHALRKGSHVRIDTLEPLMPRGVQRNLTAVQLIVMCLFALAVSFYSWRLALRSLSLGAKTVGAIMVPIWVPQSLMAWGFSVLTLEALLILGTMLVERLPSVRLKKPLLSAGTAEVNSSKAI